MRSLALPTGLAQAPRRRVHVRLGLLASRQGLEGLRRLQRGDGRPAPGDLPPRPRGDRDLVAREREGRTADRDGPRLARDARGPRLTLALHEWGDPTASRIVCLHGVASHGRHFAMLAEDALDDLHVLAPDLLGHGSSPYEPPWDIEAHLDAIEEVVGDERSAFVGHSFGGRLAFELAARAPDLARRLVLLDPAIHLPPEVALFAAENARRERAYVSFEEAIEQRYVESQLQRAPRELVEEELRAHLVSDDEGLYRYRYCQSAVVAAYGEMASAPPSFENVHVPTLLVLGKQSYLSYDHLLEAHRAALGDLLEVVVVPGGHTVLWDAFEETAEAVGAFLAAGVPT
ncbi:MAG: alpha/beta hydrolase [Actinobacteria bacterium]|nr:MAG: alpha/beta hydrolase [Actinomycetota bacterium]TML73244.1 MAG: alpha/beta hydrolase [Actinomycetota bacterium]